MKPFDPFDPFEPFDDPDAPPLFHLGELYCTPEVFENICSIRFDFALRRHRIGFWGEVSQKVYEANDFALEKGKTLYSCQPGASCCVPCRLWLITRGDRSRTTVTLGTPRMSTIRHVSLLRWQLRSHLRRAVPCPTDRAPYPALIWQRSERES